MQASSQVKVRLSKGEIRRLTLPSPASYSLLISRLFPAERSLPENSIKMTYMDEEGDRVGVCCDEDLREALEHLPKGKDTLLLEAEAPFEFSQEAPLPTPLPAPTSEEPPQQQSPPLKEILHPLIIELLGFLLSLLALFPFVSSSSLPDLTDKIKSLSIFGKIRLILLSLLCFGFLNHLLGQIALVLWYLVLIKVAWAILKGGKEELKRTFGL